MLYLGSLKRFLNPYFLDDMALELPQVQTRFRFRITVSRHGKLIRARYYGSRLKSLQGSFQALLWGLFEVG